MAVRGGRRSASAEVPRGLYVYMHTLINYGYPISLSSPFQFVAFGDMRARKTKRKQRLEVQRESAALMSRRAADWAPGGARRRDSRSEIELLCLRLRRNAPRTSQFGTVRFIALRADAAWAQHSPRSRSTGLSHVQIPHELGMLLDELVAQLRLTAHQALDQLDRVLVVALAGRRQRHPQ